MFALGKTPNCFIFIFGLILAACVSSLILRSLVTNHLAINSTISGTELLLPRPARDKIFLRRQPTLPPNISEDIKKKAGRNWKTILRVKADRELRCANAPPWPVDPGEPTGFALIFLVVRHVETRLIWERWLRDAYDWIHQEGLEDENVPPHESNILRTFVHFSGAFSRDKIKELMTPMMRESPIEEPESCAWNSVAPCFRRGLQYPYDTWADAGYFSVLSHNQVPVKPFSVMYKAFLQDQRARVTMWKFAFDENTLAPKEVTWKSMPRAIVRPLIERPHWLKLGWESSPENTAAVEEGQQWTAVMGEYGEAFAEMIHPGQMAGYPKPWSRVDPTYFHMDCWFGVAPNECYLLGENSTENPRSFKSVTEKGLLATLENPHIWTFRKVSQQSTVLTQNGHVLLADYLATYWNSAYASQTYEDHPALSMPLTWNKGLTMAENVARWKEGNVFGLK
eukprot:Blabericola_migrator_1__12183@NODE_755_length_6648_cov_53_314086_g541_i0_p3_GENE_NODE_755_length_6648_cov_53_314086_g541_i0NODE_755_length_6648_cov_53_314086_g541_i0_p3_ORF_typecomplete_len453_score56_83Branch/PF02485_21/0_0061_NODE_755_length_6648_cov_53_314086_g541_i048546212